MKKLLIALALLLSVKIYAQTGSAKKCLSYDNLVALMQGKTDKQIEAYLARYGFTLTVNSGDEIMFSADETVMLTVEKDESQVISVRYNASDEACFKAMEEQVAAAKLVKDISWDTEAGASTGYEGQSTGIFLYKALTYVENDGVKTYSNSYIISLYPKEQYLAKKEKYKSNPRLKVTEY